MDDMYTGYDIWNEDEDEDKKKRICKKCKRVCDMCECRDIWEFNKQNGYFAIIEGYKDDGFAIITKDQYIALRRHVNIQNFGKDYGRPLWLFGIDEIVDLIEKNTHIKNPPTRMTDTSLILSWVYDRGVRDTSAIHEIKHRCDELDHECRFCGRNSDNCPSCFYRVWVVKTCEKYNLDITVKKKYDLDITVKKEEKL